MGLSSAFWLRRIAQPLPRRFAISNEVFSPLNGTPPCSITMFTAISLEDAASSNPWPLTTSTVCLRRPTFVLDYSSLHYDPRASVRLVSVIVHVLKPFSLSSGAVIDSSCIYTIYSDRSRQHRMLQLGGVYNRVLSYNRTML